MVPGTKKSTTSIYKSFSRYGNICLPIMVLGSKSPRKFSIELYISLLPFCQDRHIEPLVSRRQHCFPSCDTPDLFGWSGQACFSSLAFIRRKLSQTSRDEVSYHMAQGCQGELMRPSVSKNRGLSLQIVHSTISLLTFVMIVIAIEFTIFWNDLCDVYSIKSTGQMIPFLIGVATLFRVVWKYFWPTKMTTSPTSRSMSTIALRCTLDHQSLQSRPRFVPSSSTMWQQLVVQPYQGLKTISG